MWGVLCDFLPFSVVCYMVFISVLWNRKVSGQQNFLLDDFFFFVL